MNETSEKLLVQLMKEVEKLCNEEGIPFLAQFQLGDKEIYHCTSGHVLLDTQTIMTQLQLLEARKGIKI